LTALTWATAPSSTETRRCSPATLFVVLAGSAVTFALSAAQTLLTAVRYAAGELLGDELEPPQPPRVTVSVAIAMNRFAVIARHRVTSVSFSLPRVRGQPRPARPSAAVWALVGALLLAAFNFFWGLGSPSYFTDEVFSIEHSLPSLGDIVHVVDRTELNPWGYFFLLHGWLHAVGSQAPWVTRLPSAIVGVLLVGAVFWTARAFVGVGAAAGAALICAFNPVVLQYAQEVRMYVFAMLAVTVAVGATVRALGRPAHAAHWLALGAIGAILSMWFHYTAAFVVVPLCAWVATRQALGLRARAIYVTVCSASGLALIPIFREQHHRMPNGGVTRLATLTVNNVLRVLGAPFSAVPSALVGRLVAGINVFSIIALVAGLAVAARLLTLRESLVERWLLFGVAFAPTIAVLVGGVLGTGIVTSRYIAVGTPLLAIAFAAAIASLPRPPAIALAAAMLVVAAWGVVRTHTSSGFWPSARQAIEYVDAKRESGDVVLTSSTTAPQSYQYYVEQVFHTSGAFVGSSPAASHDHRIWWIDQVPSGEDRAEVLRPGRLFAQQHGYRVAGVRAWTTSATVILYLMTPDG
jgi:Dolichyl-phosphate-mannose-protein mannosyltransferase